MDNVPFFKNLLLIGGSGRNVGKTTLALEIIKIFSKQAEIIGLKVSTHHKGDELKHGTHTIIPADNYVINIEKNDIPRKDTARMLQSGVSDAYYIESAGEKVKIAFEEFYNKYNPLSNPVICESRSLRKYIKPGIYILLLGPNGDKLITDEEKSLADIIYSVNFEDHNFNEITNKLMLTSDGWSFNNKPPQRLDAVL